MSDPKGFRRCDGFVGCIPQNWINGHFPVCPMCGSHDPYWTLKDKMEFTANRVLFRCKDCGCILSATNADFTGATKSTAFTALTTAGLVNAIGKKKQGKDLKTVYVKIEDVGDFHLDKSLQGKELPLEELKQFAQSFQTGPQNFINPQQPTYAQPEPVQVSEDLKTNKILEQEPSFTVNYQDSEPQPANFTVNYQAPAPEYYDRAPEFYEPPAIEQKYSAPGFTKPFAFISAAFAFIVLILTAISNISSEQLAISTLCKLRMWNKGRSRSNYY